VTERRSGLTPFWCYLWYHLLLTVSETSGTPADDNVDSRSRVYGSWRTSDQGHSSSNLLATRSTSFDRSVLLSHFIFLYATERMQNCAIWDGWSDVFASDEDGEWWRCRLSWGDVHLVL
jgi:hypothetical protein